MHTLHLYNSMPTSTTGLFSFEKVPGCQSECLLKKPPAVCENRHCAVTSLYENLYRALENDRQCKKVGTRYTSDN